jgi:hypothetical protein
MRKYLLVVLGLATVPGGARADDPPPSARGRSR